MCKFTKYNELAISAIAGVHVNDITAECLTNGLCLNYQTVVGEYVRIIKSINDWDSRDCIQPCPTNYEVAHCRLAYTARDNETVSNDFVSVYNSMPQYWISYRGVIASDKHFIVRSLLSKTSGRDVSIRLLSLHCR